jgi:hypothetical protein
VHLLSFGRLPVLHRRQQWSRPSRPVAAGKPAAGLRRGGGIAGVAAALAARQAAGDVGKLDVRALQHALSEQGFLLDPALLKL